MSRYHSYNHYWWIEPLMALVLVIALIFGIKACQADERQKCEQRGGVWLVRESACVAGPGSNG